VKRIMIIISVVLLTVLFGVLVNPPSAAVGGVPALALVFLVVFGIQGIGFVHAVINDTEHFYDLIGSLSFMGSIIAAAIISASLTLQGVLLVLMVMIWACRLGSFLFIRVKEVGEDQRFRKIKASKLRFAVVWTLQGLWVSITSCAALVAVVGGKPLDELNLMGQVTIGLGVAVWLLGFTTEVIADRQKAMFRRDPSNKGAFIKTGLWARSRHPNYWGEMVLWAGVAIVASPALVGVQWLVWISPIFVYLLLTRLSGIPTLVQRAESTWGDDPEYRQYVANTPRLMPKFFT